MTAMLTKISPLVPACLTFGMSTKMPEYHESGNEGVQEVISAKISEPGCRRRSAMCAGCRRWFGTAADIIKAA
jgi:hypothetical protein